MKALPVFFLLTAAAGQLCLAQDEAITAPTTTITILITEYGSQSAGSCASFAAKSIMNSISQTLSIGNQTTGAGAGKVIFNPFTIAKNVDNCSARLFMQTASGTPFEELVAVVEPPKTSRQPTFLIRLGLAAISNLADGAADGTTILEKVTFEYGDITVAQIDPITQNKSCAGWERGRNVSDSSHCAELYAIALSRYNSK